MRRMVHAVQLACAPQAVFDYVSTPAHWPAWHPASLRVAPGAERPLPVGAVFEEDIRAGGRDGHLSWTVRKCQPPLCWVATAVMSNGGQLRLMYEVRPQAGGAEFVRTLEYRMPGALWKLLDTLLLRRRIERESQQSLRQLKQVLESAAPQAAAA